MNVSATLDNESVNVLDIDTNGHNVYITYEDNNNNIRVKRSGYESSIPILSAAFVTDDSRNYLDGDSGVSGTGISLSADYTPSTPIKMVIIETAGNFCFETIKSGSSKPHVLPVADMTMLDGIIISKIYGSSHGTYPTTASKIHVFY